MQSSPTAPATRSRQRRHWTELSSTFPWWANLIAAACVYVVLAQWLPGHAFEHPAAVAAARIGPALAFVLVFACVFGALVSIFRVMERECLRIAIADGEAFRNMPWREFRMRLTGALREEGYAVHRTLDLRDDAIDIVLKRGGERYLVQCRTWRAARVNERTVEDLREKIMRHHARGGFVVTIGQFTAAARRAADLGKIVLLDGTDLERLLVTDRCELPDTCDDAVPAS